MLIHRLLAALVLIPCVVAVLFLLPLTLFAVLAILICVLAAWEWMQFIPVLATRNKVILTSLFGLFLAILYTIFHPAHLAFFSGFLYLSTIWWCIALWLIINYPGSATYWRNSLIFKVLAGIIILVGFFAGIILLRQYETSSGTWLGSWLLLYVFVLVWGIDSGAYAVGRLWGKHKLLPSVSPGKTIEGFFGGLLFAVIIAVIFDVIAILPLTSASIYISAVIIALVSALGDLTESMFKREAKIKDSGRLIPGHGGMLDRIDSLTAAVPIFAFYLLNF